MYITAPDSGNNAIIVVLLENNTLNVAFKLAKDIDIGPLNVTSIGLNKQTTILILHIRGPCNGNWKSMWSFMGGG